MMKKAIKKLLAALLAVAMLCAMAVPAFATDETAGATGTATTHNSSSANGTITINNAVNGTEYKIYRILDLQYNEATKSYRYVTNNTWNAFVTEKSDYLTINEGGNVTWKENADIAEFAQLARQHVSDAKVKPEKTEDGYLGSAKFTGLPLGWYLVVSNLTTDSICSIDTTAPDAIIEEKNSNPTIDKHVYVGNLGEKSNNAGIGDTVNFMIQVNVTDGKPANYVVHDSMSAGLNFNKDITVYRYNPSSENPGSLPDFSNATLNSSNYTVITNATDCTTYNNSNCTFEVRFNEGVLKHNDIVVIKYSATVNEKAVIGVAGNPNKTTLTYNNGHTEESTTKTYVWEMGVHKYTNLGTGKEDTALADAEFKLYKGADANKKYASFSTANTVDGTSVYKLTGWVADAGAATAVVTPASGNIKLEGLDAGTYYLEETKAPVGYNKLTAPLTVKVESTLPTAAGTNATYTVKYGTEDTAADADNRVPVINQAGVELPSTGGMGTTLFYVVGGGLMVAAIVLLVTKKRMENK